MRRAAARRHTTLPESFDMRPTAVVSFAFCLATLGAASAWAQTAPPARSEVATLIETALASDIRTAEERARDEKERKPVQTLEFFGLRPDMAVLELVPGAGWYTKVLAPVLADRGKLYIAIGTTRVAAKLKEWKLDKVEVVDVKADLKPSAQPGVFEAASIEMPVRNADLVLTFRNQHNFTPATRAMINRAAFEALKPGGIYGVVDHTRRHMEPASPENWRRMDPVLAIKEITAAGFEFVDFSDLHYRPDDELRYDTQRPSIAGYSDRFTLKFRKPAGK
jgi:predicted methyltransferase